MNLLELVDEIGLDNISVQPLNESISNIVTSGEEAKVTFYTTELTPDDMMSDTGNVGLILWVDKQVLESCAELLQDQGK